MRYTSVLLAPLIMLILLPALVPIYSNVHSDSYCYVHSGKLTLVLNVSSDADPWVKHNINRICNFTKDIASKVIDLLGINEPVYLNVTVISFKYAYRIGLRSPILFTKNGVIVVYEPYELRWHILHPNITKYQENLEHILYRIADGINMYIINKYVAPWYPGEVTWKLAEGLNTYFILNTLPIKIIEIELLGLHRYIYYLISHGIFMPLKKVLDPHTLFQRAYFEEAISFTYWLIEEYSIKKYIKLYVLMHAKPSIDCFKEVYGLSLDELEKQWLSYLRERYGDFEDYQPSFELLALTNTTIVYDDSYSLSEAAQLLKATIVINFVYSHVANNTVYIKPYSKVGDLSKLLKKHNVIVITLSNSSTFKNLVNILRGDYIGYCSDGFRFLDKCYSNRSDVLILITKSNYGGALGIILGNDVESLTNYLRRFLIPTITPEASGCLYTNNTVYIILPLTMKYWVKSKMGTLAPKMHYSTQVMLAALTVLIIVTYVIMKRRK